MSAYSETLFLNLEEFQSKIIVGDPGVVCRDGAIFSGESLFQGHSALGSLRSWREWVPVRTSVRNASTKSRAGREKNGEESS